MEWYGWILMILAFAMLIFVLLMFGHKLPSQKRRELPVPSTNEDGCAGELLHLLCERVESGFGDHTGNDELEHLTATQQTVYAVQSYLLAMEDDGIAHYFTGHNFETASLLPDAMQEVGGFANAQLFLQFTRKNNLNLNALDLESSDGDALDATDLTLIGVEEYNTAFEKLQKTENLSELNLSYVSGHLEEFDILTQTE